MEDERQQQPRWYEKHPEIKELMAFIRTLEREQQIFITQQMLQILINECDMDLDSELTRISRNNYTYKRWYDADYGLSASFELLKDLPDIKRNFVVRRVLAEIVMGFAKKEI